MSLCAIGESRYGPRQLRRWPVLLAVAAAWSAGGQALGQSITVINQHPRLIFRVDGTPGAKTFQDVRDLYNGNSQFHDEVQSWLNSGFTDPINQAARYVVTGNLAYAESALSQMYSGSLSYGDTEGAETGIHWALAYDWIYNAWEGTTPPANLAAKLANIEGKIASWTSSALADLDGGGPSLWHGRAAVGALAWVTALSLPTGNSTYDTYRSRAWSHWQQSLKATHAAGAWPEGPTYWANNRAINFPIAYQAYLSAVASAPALAVADPLDDLRAMGLWQAYSERGDGSLNRYGDVASAVTIVNGTLGRSIDEYAMATQDPALAAFAQFARKYRSPLYYSGYGWMYPVGYDPTQPKPPTYNPANPGACLEDALPHAMVFGRDAEGFAVMRQGWQTGDTQISFKAGDYLAHHGHYDQGTFTIFKYSKLVINSGGYGDYTGDHRLNYYVRTVAKNSILVQRPDELWTPPSVTPPSGWANDGGQRIVQATGSTVTSYENWLANKTSGWNYESGDITAFQSADGQYAYVGSDITRAYNSTLYDSEGQGGKVSQVTRQMVYLEDADVLVVFDRVNSTNPAYKKKWLLHTPNKFVGGGEVVALGSATNGIIEVDGDTIPNHTMTMTNGGGKLFLQTLLPASYTVNKVGGTGYRYYVETDGNDADGYDGVNESAGYTEQSWHDYGDWRIEISPKTASNFDTFLNVLSPRSSTTASVESATVLLNGPLATVMQVGTHVVGFGTTGQIDQELSYGVASGGTTDHLIADLPPGEFYKIFGQSGYQFATASDEGVLSFLETGAGPHAVTLRSVLADPPPGDATRDGVVDGADYTVWADNYKLPGTWDEADFNADGTVDGADYTIWADNFTGGAASVPEPAAMGMLGLGALALLRRRRWAGPGRPARQLDPGEQRRRDMPAR